MKTLSRDAIQRMTGTSSGGTRYAGGSGGTGGGGGGSVPYAAEAGHAQEADSATTAQNLDANSTDWQKIADKTIVQTIAEVWTFAKGIISTLKSYFNGGIEVTGGTKTDSLNVTGNTAIGGTLNVTGNTTGTTADFTDVTMDNLGNSNDRVAKIWADNIDAKDIATESLNVTKDAHFTKLVVDELLSNKGAIVISSANCVVEKVEEEYSSSVLIGWRVYFTKVDKNGNSVVNSWKLGDLALCLTYNGEGTGTFNDVRNRYYWRRVRGRGSSDTSHYIILSNVANQYEAASGDAGIPAVGDNLVQLGYMGSLSYPDRQTAIILSSYPTMDAGVTPPSLTFYKGINEFNLSNHRYTCIDGVKNDFFGDFKIIVNGSYTDFVQALRVTGVNVTDGEIKLMADKVNFYDSSGTNLNPKIWIDPTTGTLHAVDGDFSGTINAKNLFREICLAVPGLWDGQHGVISDTQYSPLVWQYMGPDIGSLKKFGFYTEAPTDPDELAAWNDDAVKCIGTADFVNIAINPGAITTYNLDINLPDPRTMPGKLVEITATALSTLNTFTYTVGCTRPIDPDWHDPDDPATDMVTLLTLDSNGRKIYNITPNVAPAGTSLQCESGRTYRFLSVEGYSSSSAQTAKYVWLMLS